MASGMCKAVCGRAWRELCTEFDIVPHMVSVMWQSFGNFEVEFKGEIYAAELSCCGDDAAHKVIASLI